MSQSTENDLERILADLKSPSFRRRHRAAKALAEAKDEKSVPALITAINETGSQDWPIRIWVIKALGEIRDPRVVSVLSDVVATKITSDSEAGEVVCAVEALGRIGSVEAVPVLLEALQASDLCQSLSEFYETPGKFASGAGVVYLGQWLMDFEDDVRELRAEAARALGRIGDTRAVQGLIEAMWEEEIEYGDTAPREEAVWALEQIGTPEALAAVEEWRREQEE